MHILHLTPYYAPAYRFGGVVRAVEGLSHALVARGHRVTVLTTNVLSLDDTMPVGVEEQGRLTIMRARNWLPFLRHLNMSSPLGMRHLAQNVLPDVDVLHVHEFRTVENVLVVPRAARMNRPIVLAPHGTLTQHTGRSQLKKGWDRLLSPAVAQPIRHVVALTHDELADCRALWARFSSKPTMSVIPNGIDLDEFAQLPDPAIFRRRYQLGDAKIVLFLGRLHPRKGVDVLLKAFLQANMPDGRLVLAGPDEGAHAQIHHLLDERVVLTGYLNPQERLAALSAADLFALPAVGEGLSIAVLEALACGVPVLLSPGSTVAGVADFGAGRVVAPDVDMLATALQEMLSDLAKLEKMGHAARQLAQSRYAWAQVATQMEAVYQSLL